MKADGGFVEFIQKILKKETRRSTFEIPAEADLTSWLQSGETGGEKVYKEKKWILR